MNTTEFWSLYDESMVLQVAKHPSNVPIPSGLYHLSVEVWPFDGQRFFLTKRSNRKKSFPGFWECIGGSVLALESFQAGAVREVKEELGIETGVEDYCFLTTEKKDHHFVAVFLLNVDSDTAFFLSSKEIDEGKWFSLQELESLHLDMSFVPFQFERYLRYVRSVAFSTYMQNKPGSIRRMVSAHSELQTPKRGLPHSGCRPSGRPYSGVLRTIADAFEVYGEALYAKTTLLPETENNSLGSGSPMAVQPFPPITQALCSAAKSEILSQYPFPAGDISCRRSVCDYLHAEGFSAAITADSIIFTDSTTQAFHLILEMILRPGDVVLFTAPTYGLFAFEPERCGGESRF